MRLTLCLIAALTATSPALADCVTKDDLARGVAFKRQDGRAGLIKAKGKGFEIDYALGSKTAWQDQRSAIMGIYETALAVTPTDEYYVGGGPGGLYGYKFVKKPPVPTEGASWKSVVKVTDTQDNGTENGPEISKYSVDVVYSFQAVKEAKLSGCSYRIMPVEATFTGENTHLTQRYIYFPDLGFGLETRVTVHNSGEDRKLGLTALTPAK